MTNITKICAAPVGQCTKNKEVHHRRGDAFFVSTGFAYMYAVITNYSKICAPPAGQCTKNSARKKCTKGGAMHFLVSTNKSPTRSGMPCYCKILQKYLCTVCGATHKNLCTTFRTMHKFTKKARYSEKKSA